VVVKAYIGAAYGIHQDSGKLRTGYAIVPREFDCKLAKSFEADSGMILSCLEHHRPNRFIGHKWYHKEIETPNNH
jgi:hypothetical protein